MTAPATATEAPPAADALDLSDMEEFEVEANDAWADIMRSQTAAHARALVDEEAAAELARLREQVRAQAERDAEAKRVKDAEDAAAWRMALRVAARARKSAAAQAEAAAATRRALDAEAGWQSLGHEGHRRVIAGLATTTATAAPEARRTAAGIDAELALQQELHNALAGKTRAEVVQALVHGTLHPAITINWGKVAGGQG